MTKKIRGLNSALIIFYMTLSLLLGTPQIVPVNAGESSQEARLYFAYGSNMDFDQMNLRCLNPEFRGLAQLKGYQFIINGRGVASLRESPDHFVQGVLWKISNDDEAMLDLFEGVAGGFYVKEDLLVEDLTSGETLETLVYLGTDLALGEPRSGYLEKILKAAQTNGLDKCYIKELEAWKKNEKES